MGRGVLQHREAGSRSIMLRSNIMIVEMMAAEQQTYIRYDDATGTVLTFDYKHAQCQSLQDLDCGGHCSDSRYKDTLAENQA